MDVVPDVIGIQSALASVVSGTAGTCAASGGGLVPPLVDPVFDTPYQQCVLELGGGCQSGSCVARGGEDWSRPCIYGSGDTACDAAPFTDKLVIDVIDVITSDERDCTACACSTPPACDQRSLMLFAEDSCGASPTGVTVDGVCSTISAQAVHSVSFNAGASCTFQGGQPTGDIRIEPATICCIP
jgi:hypothetical protein